jgi:protein TonB
MADSALHTFVTVDWAARPKPNNPSPVYPTALRSAQLEGAVVAQFIVDTLGRAEPASINIKEATHPLFGDAVRQALLRSRYEPAMASNRRVRQLVEQRFTFTLFR